MFSGDLLLAADAFNDSVDGVKAAICCFEDFCFTSVVFVFEVNLAHEVNVVFSKFVTEMNCKISYVFIILSYQLF